MPKKDTVDSKGGAGAPPRDRKKLDRRLYDAVKQSKVVDVERYLAEGANPEAPVGKGGKTCIHRCKDLAIEQLILARVGSRSSGLGASDVEGSATLLRRQESLLEEALGGDAMTFVPVLLSRDHGSLSGYGEVGGTMAFGISRLADGVRSSVRQKRKGGSSAARGVGEYIGVGDGMQALISTASKAATRQWEFDRSKLRQVRKLGQGTFGVVFEGIADDLVPGQKQTRVAVKMLNAEGEEVQKNFAKEVKIMQAIDGPHNIVRLLGVCTEAQPFLMIMELMARGDLKTVLRDNRPKDTQPSSISYQRLALMGADIAEGMAYLASCHIVHRDLAARNCLVGEELNVKIGDFGLTRDVDQGEYYRMTGSAPLPIRWMSPEAIMDGIYSTQSDVWAFGVVLWELATFAKMPYQGLSNGEVCDQVTEEHYRLPIPKGCPASFSAVMEKCWQEDPDARGAFEEHSQTLGLMATTLPNTPIAKVDSGKGQGRTSGDSGGRDLSASTDSRKTGYNISAASSEDGDHAYDVQRGPAAAARSRAASSTTSHDQGSTLSSESPYREWPAYLREEEKESASSFYVDSRYAHLSSMAQALKSAEMQKGITEVGSLPAAAHEIVTRSVSEAVYSEPALRGPVGVHAAAAAIEKTSAGAAVPLSGKGKFGAPPASALSSTTSSIQSSTSAASSAQSIANLKAAGAKTKGQDKGKVTDSSNKDPTSNNSSSVAAASTSKDQGSKKSKTGFQIPAGGGAPPPPAVAVAPSRSGASLELSHSALPPRAMSGSPKLMRKFQGGSTSRKHLANDTSAIADKVREASSQQADKAEKDVSTWIEALLHVSLPGPLHDSLRTGEVLCSLLNRLKPGLVPKVHENPRMAFRQMENIGWFLEGCKEFGVPSSDLFMTVDLFDATNMRQVVICLNALRLRAAEKNIV